MSPSRQSKPSRFGSEDDSLVRVLGPLEAAIMRLLWREQRGTAAQMYARLGQQQPLGYAALLKTLGHLVDEGMIQCQRQGLTTIYAPALSEQEFAEIVVCRLLDGLLADYGDMVLSHTVEYLAQHHPGQLERMHGRVQAHLGQGGQELPANGLAFARTPLPTPPGDAGAEAVATRAGGVWRWLLWRMWHMLEQHREPQTHEEEARRREENNL